ncbi:MAG: M23 family metallopeptidase [Candidatus Latescibacteria bacterium]|nr:M23 family metallopeptidase [Candidatus Latescibacterota bacterium]MCK5380833.1 M23 family metallopeptidase [Candidatus Latescibacterota bacterium]
MTKTKRYISVLLVPEDGSSIREFKVSSRIFGLLKGFSIVLLVVLLSAGVAYWKASRWALAARRMEEENRMLRAENAKVVTLARMLEEVRQSRQRLEVMLRGEVPKVRETPAPGSVVLRSPELRMRPRSRPTIRITELTKTRRTSRGGLRRRPSLWPVEGRVTTRFEQRPGWLKREYYGIAIAAAEGALVRAAADGEVTFAGWENALGNLMILDHGGRYTTWYGRNEQLLVQEGELVRKGQAIALAGNSGHGKGVYLHYEVWENGTPVDPEAFLLW